LAGELEANSDRILSILSSFRVTADRTKDICVEFGDFIENPATQLTAFPHKHLRALLDYTFSSCADLDRLCVR